MLSLIRLESVVLGAAVAAVEKWIEIFFRFFSIFRMNFGFSFLSALRINKLCMRICLCTN